MKLFAFLGLILFPFFCEGSQLHQKHKNLCRGQPTITRKHENALQWLFKNIGESSIVSSISPQHEAACWYFRQNKGSFSPQRYVMAVIFYATKGAKWNTSTDWMTSKHECSWFGVKCNAFKKIVELDLGYIEVDGLVPREIGLLKELKDLDLHGNDLQGTKMDTSFLSASARVSLTDMLCKLCNAFASFSIFQV
jgi:hypothetical protein